MVTCVYCNKSFKQPNGLSRHMLLHRGQKLRLSCSLCNKTYGRLDNFRRHFSTHGAKYIPPRNFFPRDEATIPNLYERPTEVTGRILLPSNNRFRTIAGNTTPKTKKRTIPIIIIPHNNRTRYHRGFIGRALPRHFPTFPQWHQNLLNTSQLQQDLYLTDEENEGEATP